MAFVRKSSKEVCVDGRKRKDNNDVRHSSMSFVRQRIERLAKARFNIYVLKC